MLECQGRIPFLLTDNYDLSGKKLRRYPTGNGAVSFVIGQDPLTRITLSFFSFFFYSSFCISQKLKIKIVPEIQT